ncbi:MAG: phosphoglycerate mutase family protein [Delftia acidovorans]|jgi:broad specificity phosphatase PhoE|uniref:histidine phosphatase family protein n=1 Tax=Delftia acidovorans TaxID=80866 RepID=UPI00282F391D|nr:phosphoglycerate mutase family protein [Delftia acidovorans]
MDFGKIQWMEIILIRHGKPGFTDANKVAAHEMPKWIESYDLSEIGDDEPPQACRLMARRSRMAASSSLPRAVSSGAALNLELQIVDGIFREAELPIYSIPILKLSPFVWMAIFRLIWLCGMSREAESFYMAKKRARRAAGMLINHAKEHDGPILLVGHGIMNRLIARELMALGWKARSRAGNGYWSASVFKF